MLAECVVLSPTALHCLRHLKFAVFSAFLWVQLGATWVERAIWKRLGVIYGFEYRVKAVESPFSCFIINSLQ